MKSLLIVFPFFCICISGLEAQTVTQSVIASDGGSGKGAGVQLDYTLGEMAVDGLTGQQVSITEGFQQPFLRIEEAEPGNTNPGNTTSPKQESIISLSPNPVAAELTVKFSHPVPQAIALDVRDANGIMVLQKQLDPISGDSQIDVSDFPPGVYYFQFTSIDQQVLTTYKISKIQ